MSIEISKELLGKVLGVDIRKINNSILDGNLYYYKTFVKCKSKINIYELAHKCKQWALKQGYYFSTYSFNFSFNTEQEHRIRLLIGNNVVYSGNDSCEESEVEAIFKACQWILENKDNK